MHNNDMMIALKNGTLIFLNFLFREMNIDDYLKINRLPDTPDIKMRISPHNIVKNHYTITQVLTIPF